MEEKKEEQVSSPEECIIEERIPKFNGDTIIKRYQKGKLLGRGGFARCYETTNLETNKVYAVKIIQKSSLTRCRAKQKLISEIKIHKSVHHEHIVEFVHVFEDINNVYILLGLCSNNTLNELLKRRKRLKEVEVQCYVLQIIGALRYLHELKIIHRDLKLGNLFLNDSMEMKLGDFGLAAKLEYDGELKKTVCGTPNYIAPEILESKGHSFQVDVWSLGVIIYTQIVGKPPFETQEVKTTYKKIKSGIYVFPEHVQISEQAKSLVTRILVTDPAKRPSLEEVLAHPFLAGSIPKTMPRSTLACPPSATYTESFEKKPSVSVVRPVTTGNLGVVELEHAVNQPQEPNPRGSSKDLRNVLPRTRPQTRIKEVYVRRWVDYSSKYGLGYILTNGETGVYFNDSTKLTLTVDGQTVRYIEKQPDRTDQITKYKMNELPTTREIQKKTTLLRHFQAYLEETGQEESAPSEHPADGENVYYVKKWMKTKYAILFRLSNKIVQVNFTDRTELILSSEQKLVTYVNKEGVGREYPLVAAMDSENVEMTKRLKYTRELLTHMLHGSMPDREHREPREP
jgi:polo-like kinase 1